MYALGAMRKAILFFLAYARKGKFLSMSSKTVVYLDESFCVYVDGVEYSSTIRHHDCQLLIDDTLLWLSQHSLVSTKLTLRTPSIYTNLRFLKKPQKIARLMSLRKAIKIKKLATGVTENEIGREGWRAG